MTRTRFDNINCGVAQAVEQLGDGWTLLIIRDAIVGATRFQQFESNLGIAKNVLSDRLAKLVEHGVFAKTRLDEPGTTSSPRTAAISGSSSRLCACGRTSGSSATRTCR